jgi:predicted DNA-binding transcriptional regulator AlpA
MRTQFNEDRYELEYDKPLWQLTMQEFIGIQKQEMAKLVKEMLNEALNDIKSKDVPLEDTISAEDAAVITGLKMKTIYSKVSRLQIPSITRGRPLVFSRAELQNWMKIGRPTVAEMEFKRRKGLL